VICAVTQLGTVVFLTKPPSMCTGVAVLAEPANVECGIVITMNCRRAIMIMQVPLWRKASNACLASLHKKAMFKNFAKALLEGIKPIHVAFVYDLTTTAEGLSDVTKASEGHKGRFVVKDDMQVPKINYDQNNLYSPTAIGVPLMVSLSLVVKYGYELKEVNVKTCLS
jgi:hypothetical protein